MPTLSKHKGRRAKRTTACDISPKVRQIVKERDGSMCIWCGKWLSSPQICHYISRGAGGLGIQENLACGCNECHREADQGAKSKQYKEKMKSYLKSRYTDWDETKLRYQK